MNLVIACLLVSGCLCAPSGNSTDSTTTATTTTTTTTTATPLSSSSSSAVSSTSQGGNVVYSITQKFTFGTPNDTSSLGVIPPSMMPGMTHTFQFGPSASSIFQATNQKIAAMRDRNNAAAAAIERQNKAHFNMVNSMMSPVHNAFRVTHNAIQSGMRTMFSPFSNFVPWSPFSG